MSSGPIKKRGFVFTLNNYSEEEHQEILKISQQHSKYWIIGEESGSLCETPHLQCYIYFKDAKETGWVRKLLPKRVAEIKWAKYEPKNAKDTWQFQNNGVYCSKGKKYQTNMPEKYLKASVRKVVKPPRPYDKNDPLAKWIYDAEGNKWIKCIQWWHSRESRRYEDISGVDDPWDE